MDKGQASGHGEPGSQFNDPSKQPPPMITVPDADTYETCSQVPSPWDLWCQLKNLACPVSFERTLLVIIKNGNAAWSVFHSNPKMYFPTPVTKN